MKTTSAKIALLTLVAALLLPALASAQQADTHADGNTNAIHRMTPTTGHPLPLHGSIAAVNTDAMTVTVGNTVLTVTPKTRIFKAGEPATLSDLKVGDVVNVSYVKAADGTSQALGIRVVVHPPVKPRQPTDAAPAQPGHN